MRKIVAITTIMIFFFLFVQGQDTLRKNRFVVNTYPSNLLAGDISVGVEHIYKKRLSHEFMFFVKVFSPSNVFGPNLSFYKYDKGVRLNYLIKYNFINRKYFRMSGNMSFIYKDIYFRDKEDYWSEKFMTDLGPIKSYTFLMDREIKAYGVGFGFSINFRITSRISIGNDFIFEFLNTQKSYTVKKSIKGEIPSYYYDLSIPSTYVGKYFTTYSLFPTLKVSYSL